MHDIEIAVIGAGVAGVAAARHLAKAGHEVVVFEQFEVGHTRGSSGGTSRVFRFSYEDPAYVAMAMESLTMWRELETESLETLIVTTGGLDVGRDIGGHVRALRENGAEFAVLDGPEVAVRWPGIALGGDTGILFQPDAGITLADRALEAFVGGAKAAGCELKENTTVNELAVEDSAAIVSTDGGTYRAKTAIVAAGPWARELVKQVAIDLPVKVTRETVAHFRLADEYSVPVLVEWEEPPIYALASPGVGIKVGVHHSGPEADPNESGEADPAIVERMTEWVARRYSDVDPEPALAETCLYTNTEDERFVMERHGPIVVGSACSGHGFKFGPVTGKRLADLAAGSPDGK
jgi:sarcosine oxidase